MEAEDSDLVTIQGRIASRKYFDRYEPRTWYYIRTDFWRIRNPPPSVAIKGRVSVPQDEYDRLKAMSEFLGENWIDPKKLAELGLAGNDASRKV